ncbi:MAG: ABC transporter permease subunit [Planctomycetes bacterium]|nr:ABC transporter permease subunit [Planctomycetota bacterium]
MRANGTSQFRLAKDALRDTLKWFTFSWLTGPILHKELRVSSRRRQNYWLRSTFVGLLAILVVLVWISGIQGISSVVNIKAQMGEIGKNIVVTIIIFQFCALQLLAIVMLSNSISAEIQHHTLGALMSTPITSLQIVLGKLLSKLLQLILFLAISLPILAIIRIFGGVPWGYLVSSSCITLTTVIFMASLSLFFSITNRQPYIVIIKVLLLVGTIFFIAPWLGSFFFDRFSGPYPYWRFNRLYALNSKVLIFNPYLAIFYETQTMLTPGGLVRPRGFSSAWYIQSGIMLGFSVLILIWSTIKVRKAALTQIKGGAKHVPPNPPKPYTDKRSNSKKSTTANGEIKYIKGSPIIWKERRLPLLGRRRSRLLLLIILIITFCGLVFSYLAIAVSGGLERNMDHGIYTMILFCLGLLWCVTITGTSITTEKEARSWPILLTTTITDRHILLGKAFSALRRCTIIWLFLIGHILLFTILGFINPIGLAMMIMIVTGITIFFTGTGLYFSIRCRHTTTAVIANFALAVFLWGFIPLLLSASGQRSLFSQLNIMLVEITNPFLQCSIIMDATTDNWWYFPRHGMSYLKFDWLAINARDWLNSTIIIAISMTGYILTGLIFTWRTYRRIRRDVF